MLQFLVTHVRDARKASCAGAPSSGAEPAPTAARPAVTSESPRTLPVTTREDVAEPGLPPPRATTTTSLTLLLGWWVASTCAGCACLQRDKVDANVVAARQMSLRGIDAMQHDQYDDAERLFADALRKNPTDERAHRHFAELLWRKGQREVAIRHQEESVRLSGGDSTLLVQLGGMYLQQGNAGAAEECAQEAIDTNNQLSEAWALRGDIHRQRGEPNQALECYHRALNLQPHYPPVQLAVAELYRQGERPRRALSTLEALASQYPPENVPAEVQQQRGLALQSLGRYQDAVEAFAWAAERSGPDPDLLCQLSEAQFLAGNPASARVALQAVLAQNPQHAAGLKLKDRLDRHAPGGNFVVR